MKKIALIAALFLTTITVFSQAKKVKPIKLQVLTDNHKISFEMDKDVFWFTTVDLIAYFKKVADAADDGSVNYLKSYSKGIAFKKGQTAFRNAGERVLYASIEKHLKGLVVSGKACDMVKDGNKPNLFVIPAKCPSDSTRQSLTEKKGRMVLECF